MSPPATESAAANQPSNRPRTAVAQFGDYELIEEIARGGQGVVFRARHAKLRREVALKMLPLAPWATEAHLKRFRTEARVTADLDHPAIVPIYDIGEVDGQHYFTMKLIDGVGLNRQPLPLGATRAAEIIATTARAVQHAHDRGILHRDIKPGNIILDSSGQPHITDFGLAKLMAHESTVTRTAELLGTPSYIAPESAHGDGAHVGPATDVYGLGAVLYQLLTGNPPFAGGTTLETIRQVIEMDPRPPRKWNPKIDPDLELICLKCLEKDPVRRYASAADLADDLERWQQRKPIHARPASFVYRSRKWIRRHAVVTTTAAALLCTSGALWFGFQHGGAAPAPSLAVVLRSADPDSRYLATEFSRNLIHALGSLPTMHVLPRSNVLKWESSSSSPQVVGNALGVPTLLFGTVRQSGDAFEIDAELIRVKSGETLWKRTLREMLSAGPATQAQMVRVVASKLGIELSEKNRAELRRPLTQNGEAWLHYLRARQNLDVVAEPKLLQAVAEFEAALTHDPDFAEAYSGLANAHLDLGYTFRDPATHLAKAEQYVREALKRDETLVEAIITRGVLKYFLDWDWHGAEDAVKQAVLLDPSALENHACYLHCLETTAKTDEALRLVRLASTQHPSSIAIQSELGCSAYYAGRFDEACTYWRNALKNDPENAYLHWGVGRTLAQQGKFQEAATILEAGQRKPDGDWVALVTELAYARGREGRTDDAKTLIAKMQERTKNEFVDPYLFAMAHAGLGDTDNVIRYLELAVKGRSTWIPSLPVDPKFTALRGEPRFQQLLATLKLAPSERPSGTHP